MTKRCPFCGYKLDNDGMCQNQSCPDYIRTQIIENSAKEKNNSPEN